MTDALEAPSTPGAGHAQALSRGLALLEQLAATDGGGTLTALAAALDLPAPTAYRLLTTLQHAGFVEHDDHGIWRVGVRAFRVGSAFLEHRNLTAQAHAHLTRLMEQSGETANLAVRSEGEVVFIAQVQCRELMRMSVKLGARAPMHASGAGKAMLAALDVASVARELGADPLRRYTAQTIVAREALLAELSATQRRGYAIDDEEHAPGLRCVAAAILDEYARPWAALSLAGPTSRLTRDRIAALGALVASTAREATLALGGRA